MTPRGGRWYPGGSLRACEVASLITAPRAWSSEATTSVRGAEVSATKRRGMRLLVTFDMTDWVLSHRHLSWAIARVRKA